MRRSKDKIEREDGNLAIRVNEKKEKAKKKKEKKKEGSGKQRNKHFILFLTPKFTMDNLRKWIVILVDQCCMCKKNVELVHHLLLHCEIANGQLNEDPHHG
jgi:hypothetical protein